MIYAKSIKYEWMFHNWTWGMVLLFPVCCSHTHRHMHMLVHTHWYTHHLFWSVWWRENSGKIHPLQQSNKSDHLHHRSRWPTDKSVMRFGNIARTLRDILALVLVSVFIPTVLIASQEVRRVVLRLQATYVTTYQTHKYCRLALDWCHSFSPKDCHPGLTLYYSFWLPSQRLTAGCAEGNRSAWEENLEMDLNGI